MSDFTNKMSVAELIGRTDKHMVELGYSTGTMRHIRDAWNVLRKFAASHGAEHMTPELGMTMLKEHYGIDLYSVDINGHKRLMRRSVMLLLEFQLTGGIAKRLPRYDHAFPAQYAEIGEKYIRNFIETAAPSEGTIRNHHLVLEKFFGFAAFHGADEPKDIDITIINSYVKTFAGYAKSTIAGKLNVLRRFCLFAHKEGILASEFQWPTVTVYKDRKIPEYYTADEVELILNSVDRANPRGKRDYAMLLAASRCGLRISDIKSLKFSNIDFVNNTLNITQQKTGKRLTLPLLPEVGWALIDYIRNGRPQSDCPNIFIRHVVPYQSFSTNDNLEYIIANYARLAGLKNQAGRKSSFHMLRYGLASELLRKNVSLTTISGILGHSEINITSKYTRLDFDQLRVCALEVPV